MAFLQTVKSYIIFLYQFETIYNLLFECFSVLGVYSKKKIPIKDGMESNILQQLLLLQPEQLILEITL